jgi:hypothetical protein
MLCGRIPHRQVKITLSLNPLKINLVDVNFILQVLFANNHYNFRVFGIRFGTTLYSILVVIGQLVFALGGVLDKFWLMVVGRFIFGCVFPKNLHFAEINCFSCRIGGESLAVAQNNYAVLWFKGKELNFVFGLQLSFARVGSTVNFNVMEPLYNYISQFYHGHTCLGIVLFIGNLQTISANPANKFKINCSLSDDIVFSDFVDDSCNFGQKTRETARHAQ